MITERTPYLESVIQARPEQVVHWIARRESSPGSASLWSTEMTIPSVTAKGEGRQNFLRVEHLHMG